MSMHGYGEKKKYNPNPRKDKSGFFVGHKTSSDSHRMSGSQADTRSRTMTDQNMKKMMGKPMPKGMDMGMAGTWHRPVGMGAEEVRNPDPSKGKISTPILKWRKSQKEGAV